jgi:hypothetical protein
MSVYKKLQKARVMLHETQLNKSGKNKFANFNYFELGDFIPQVTSIFEKVGLCGIVSFTPDTAYLTVHDTDGDGFSLLNDCNDNNAAINSNAIEIDGNAIDENCDGIFCTTLSISENELEKTVSLFPNPMNGVLNLSSDLPILKVEIYDMTSRLINLKTAPENSINVSDLKSGNYILKIYTEKGFTNIKMIKE